MDEIHPVVLVHGLEIVDLHDVRVRSGRQEFGGIPTSDVADRLRKEVMHHLEGVCASDALEGERLHVHPYRAGIAIFLVAAVVEAVVGDVEAVPGLRDFEPDEIPEVRFLVSVQCARHRIPRRFPSSRNE